MIQPLVSNIYQLVFILSSVLLFQQSLSGNEIAPEAKLHPNNLLKLGNILGSYFSECELVFVEDTLEANSLTPSNIILGNAPRLNILLESINGSQAFFISLRKYFQRKIVLLSLTKGNTHLPLFREHLTEKFYSPTKRDEDYFIFIIYENHLLPVLNSSVVQELKYKIAVTKSLSNIRNESAFTMCFYCGLGGTSKIISIDLKKIYSVQSLFPDFTLNGNGYKMRATSPVKYTFSTEIVKVEGGWRLVRGISKSTVENILPHYNFTYIVFSSPNGDTGAPDANGTWNGCIGQILRGEADIALTTSANRLRFQMIGFSTAIFYVYASFTTGQPKQVFSWKAIFQPFKIQLWIALIVAIGGVVIVFKIFEKFEGKILFYRNLATDITFSLIGKNVPEPEANFSRILLSIWLLSSLVVNTLYNSKIVALLAIPVFDHPPRTFEEMVNTKNFKWGLDVGGGSLQSLFESSTSPVFRKIFTNFQKPEGTINCFKRATRSNFGCITWSGVADYIAWRNFTIKDGRSPLLPSKEMASFIGCGLAMARNAVFKHTFDRAISILYDTGHGNRWITEDLQGLQQKYLKWKRQEKKTVLRYSDSGPVMLTLKNIVGVIYVYIIGNGLGILGFFGEQIFLYRNKCLRPP